MVKWGGYARCSRRLVDELPEDRLDTIKDEQTNTLPLSDSFSRFFSHIAWIDDEQRLLTRRTKVDYSSKYLFFFSHLNNSFWEILSCCSTSSKSIDHLFIVARASRFSRREDLGMSAFLFRKRPIKARHTCVSARICFFLSHPLIYFSTWWSRIVHCQPFPVQIE